MLPLLGHTANGLLRELGAGDECFILRVFFLRREASFSEMLIPRVSEEFSPVGTRLVHVGSDERLH